MKRGHATKMFAERLFLCLTKEQAEIIKKKAEKGNKSKGAVVREALDLAYSL